MAKPQIHRLSNIDAVTATATCAGCGEGVSIRYLRHKGYWGCCIGEKTRRNPANRNRNLMRKFGIGLVEYDDLFASQAGVCAICLGTCSSGRSLAVDHDHMTGRVRGLLCGTCNRGLGLMKDDPERLLRAVQYLSAAA